MADWKKLKHAEGPATRVPQQVAALTGEPEGPAIEAAHTLASTLIGKGAWFSASGPAVALLLDTLPKARRKHWVLMIVADILGADHLRAWLAGSQGPAAPKEVAAAALERGDLLLGLLDSPSANERAAALLVLAMVPALAQEITRAREERGHDGLGRGGSSQRFPRPRACRRGRRGVRRAGAPRRESKAGASRAARRRWRSYAPTARRSCRT